jgi:hypothetical protein
MIPGTMIYGTMTSRIMTCGTFTPWNYDFIVSQVIIIGFTMTFGTMTSGTMTCGTLNSGAMTSGNLTSGTMTSRT